VKIGRIILFPFTLVYAIITYIRNKLYDWEVLQGRSFDVPVISIGNLNTGGSGKTPHAEYLIRLMLHNKLNPVLLSRGYGRKTSGYLEVSPKFSAAEVGDEPFQIQCKFPKANVIVCEDRAYGIQKIMADHPDTDVIILDDAFQHRSVKPGINILLTEYHNPYSDDWILPTGNLRESSVFAKRADIIVVTKSPSVYSPIEERRLKDKLKPRGHQKLLMSYIQYKNPVQYCYEDCTKTDFLKLDDSFFVLLFAGIANPIPLNNYIQRKSKDFKFIKFADHHNYTLKDLSKIKSAFDQGLGQKKVIVTTEKDIRRIEHSKVWDKFKLLPLYYVPIEVGFHQNSEEPFDETILKYVRNHKKSSSSHSEINIPVLT
jgi:tetraacyldisaccharide 4'-kinase